MSAALALAPPTGRPALPTALFQRSDCPTLKRSDRLDGDGGSALLGDGEEGKAGDSGSSSGEDPAVDGGGLGHVGSAPLGLRLLGGELGLALEGDLDHGGESVLDDDSPDGSLALAVAVTVDDVVADLVGTGVAMGSVGLAAVVESDVLIVHGAEGGLA